MPSPDGLVTRHTDLLVNRGIAFMENLDLRGVGEAGVSTGLLVVAPLLGSGEPVAR